jgi:ribosomal protein L37AE/L43A
MSAARSFSQKRAAAALQRPSQVRRTALGTWQAGRCGAMVELCSNVCVRLATTFEKAIQKYNFALPRNLGRCQN